MTAGDHAPREALRPVATVAGILVYSWFITDLSPFTWSMDVGVAVPIALVLGAWWRRGHHGPSPDNPGGRPAPIGRVFWTTWLVALAGWELWAYFSSPRSNHPTVSSLTDQLMKDHPARAVLFTLWVSLGVRLFLSDHWNWKRRPGR